MNKNPINLAVRFLLEIVMLAVLSLWGWHLFIGWPKYLAAVVFPTIAAILWGVFRIPNDPNPAPVEIPGLMRLFLELMLFGLGVYGLYFMGYKMLSSALAIVTVLHYLVSYDRTWVMLRNKPYKGFAGGN
jgi:hypothetical protein